MMKKVVALLLCLLMVVPVFASCAKKSEDDLGAYISMYLTDQVYDLDPMHAYGNESALRLVSLVFDNLFVLDEKGKVKKSLAKSYKIVEDEANEEYGMVITLAETYWNDNVLITANDVLYAWTRILSSDNSSGAAALLYDIKNARAAKEGDVSIDKVGISAQMDEVHITFEGKIDYDQFLLNLTSYSLVPLREDKVSKSDDWAKKPSTICSSGPFKLREVSYEAGDEHMILERNAYYFRNYLKDKVDKSVTPYRIIVDYTMTDEEIMAAYEDGKLFFVGDIPLSVRGSYGEDVADIKDALSTHLYVLNQNVEINGEKIFADAKVREALSLAIDREVIAEAIYYAEAATALVPYGVFDSTSKKDLFREVGGDILASKADTSAADALLNEAGITNRSNYSFSISVPAYDEVHVKIAEMVCAAWCELGFDVKVNAIETIANDDVQESTGEVFKDIRDDIFAENLRAGKFEVVAIDYVAYSADPFSVLAPFAKAYSGNALLSIGEGMNIVYEIPTHMSGYDSEEYYELIDSAFDEKDIKARSSILHDAEKLLLEDLPVIPIVFNKTATLEHKNLSKVKYTYYGTFIFTKTKLKDYLLYIPEEEEEVPAEDAATVA